MINLKQISITACFVAFGLSGCANTGVSGSVHYGTGWYHPMYHDHWHSSPDIIIVPPPKERPERPNRPKPIRPLPSRPKPSRH